jgi:hypothetical protein
LDYKPGLAAHFFRLQQVSGDIVAGLIPSPSFTGILNRGQVENILDFIPGLTTIINLDDKSYIIAPDIMYTGYTNWEMRLRFSYLNGGESTEYGEKQNSNLSNSQPVNFLLMSADSNLPFIIKCINSCKANF